MVKKHLLTQILKQVECELNQQKRVPVISKSKKNNIKFCPSFRGSLFPKAWQQMTRWDNRLSSYQKEHLGKHSEVGELCIQQLGCEVDSTISAKSELPVLLQVKD